MNVCSLGVNNELESGNTQLKVLGLISNTNYNHVLAWKPLYKNARGVQGRRVEREAGFFKNMGLGGWLKTRLLEPA